MPPETTVVAIVPALDEEESIGAVVRSLLALPLSLEVVVVDDGSTDATARAAREAGATVLRLPANLGIGGAVQTGFRYAVARGAAAAIQVDGDGQHPAGEVARILAPVLQDEADFVIGSRFLGTGGFRSTLARRAGISVLSTALKLLLGRRVTDPTSGFRAMNRTVLRAFAEDYPEDYPEPESLVPLVRKLRARIVEVPVDMQPRQGGRSSIRGLMSVLYMAKVLTAIVVGRFR